MEEFGIPGLILMENAGRGIFEPICRHFAARLHQGITILVGPGLYFMGQLIFPLSSSKTSFLKTAIKHLIV